MSNLKPGDRIQLTQSALVMEQVIGQFLYSTAAKNSPEPEAGETGPGEP
jgi:ABC-type transporter Mla subunit MlaD